MKIHALEVAAALLLVISGLSAGAAADPRPEPRVRVLLFEGPGPILVETERGNPRHARLVRREGGLSVNGGPTLRSWRASEAGSLRVGELRVRGSVEVLSTRRGLVAVNEVGLTDYVVATLGREMSPSWEPAALRAQAVVARTYALHQRAARHRDQPYDLRADSRSQVYGGRDAESPSLRAAVRDTRGEVLTYEGTPILAAYHASSGGLTASAEEVWGEATSYLVSVAVEGEEDSPHTYWRVPISRTTLGQVASGLGLEIGSIRRAEIVERSPSGRASKIRLAGSSGSSELSGRTLRSALGDSILKSTLFQIREDPDGFVFVGSGHGHGVGMSQWGARAMARRGANYEEILEAFYPGARLTRFDGAAELQ